jgi:hypothetical protein
MRKQRNKLRSPGSYIRYCYLEGRPDAPAMFEFGRDGRAIVRLEGYEIRPLSPRRLARMKKRGYQPCG